MFSININSFVESENATARGHTFLAPLHCQFLYLGGFISFISVKTKAAKRDVSRPLPMHSALRSTARSTSSSNHPSPSKSSGQEVKTAEAEAKKAANSEVAETKKADPKGAKAKAAAEAEEKAAANSNAADSSSSLSS